MAPEMRNSSVTTPTFLYALTTKVQKYRNFCSAINYIKPRPLATWSNSTSPNRRFFFLFVGMLLASGFQKGKHVGMLTITVIDIALKYKLCNVDLMLNTLKMGSLKMGSQAV